MISSQVRTIVLVATFTVLVFFTGCRSEKGNAVESERPEKVVNVEVWTVTTDRIEDWLNLPGKIESYREVTVGAEVGGLVEWLGAEEGDRVAEGQRLAVVDRENLELAFRRAELALDQSRIRAERTRIAVEQAGLAVESARASESQAEAWLAQAAELERKARAVRDNAERERDRIRALFSEQLAPRSRLDDLNSALEIAGADLSSAVEGVKAARAGQAAAAAGLKAAGAGLKAASEDLASALSQVETAEANLQQARLFLDRSIVTAPIEGYIDRSFHEAGELVKAENPLFRIVQVAPAIAVFPLPEKDVPFLRAGVKAGVVVDSISPQPFAGRISFLSVTSDPATSTYRLKVELPNPERKLKPGMLARLSLLRQAFEEAVAAPFYSVITGDDGSHVFLFEDGLARRRQVATGIVAGDRVQILEGLSPGDHLIVKGQRDIEDGQKVAVP